MSRRSLAVRLTVALLGVGALGIAAASIRESTVSGPGTETDVGQIMAPAAGPAITVPNVALELVVLFVLVTALGAVWLSVKHPTDIVRWVGVSICVLLFALALGGTLLMTPPIGAGGEPDAGGADVDINETDPGGDDDGPEEDALVSVSFGRAIVVVGWLFALLAGLILLNARRTAADVRDGEEQPAVETDSTAAAGATTGIGAAAATAAAEIEDAEDPDNEIYRAWASMAARMDVGDPETSTPGEFAAAAIDAGIDRRHVDDLTRLFESVRYGTAQPTPERIERARRTFERIAEEYGPDIHDRDGRRDASMGRPGGHDAGEPHGSTAGDEDSASTEHGPGEEEGG